MWGGDLIGAQTFKKSGTAKDSRGNPHKAKNRLMKGIRRSQWRRRGVGQTERKSSTCIVGQEGSVEKNPMC